MIRNRTWLEIIWSRFKEGVMGVLFRYDAYVHVHAWYPFIEWSQNGFWVVIDDINIQACHILSPSHYRSKQIEVHHWAPHSEHPSMQSNTRLGCCHKNVTKTIALEATRVPSQYKDRLSRHGVSIIKIRLLWDRRIFIMGILILVSRRLCIETTPGLFLPIRL